MIRFCSCNHKGQDDLHGKGRRVFNKLKGKTSTDERYRCTVCGKEVVGKEKEE